MSIPIYPGPDAPAAELAAYQAALDLYRAETARMHAQAQADTALAMQASAEAQRALVASMSQPASPYDPVTTAVRVAAELAAHTPMTPDQIAKRARDVALQLGQEFG